MSFEDLLEKILNRYDLNHGEAQSLMRLTMENSLTPTQIGAWLCAIRTKGETAEEIAAFAEVMRDNVIPFEIKNPDRVIDTCGTGGDKSNLANVSTMTALTLAALGHKVVKHGNRSVSSTCGSADILEAAGFALQADIETLQRKFQQTNFVFLFAPQFHPAMKYVAPVRKELKVRTVFNILGPLANPSKAKLHLLGAFSYEMAKLMAHAHLRLGTSTALVVHSDDGLDELSPIAQTKYLFLHDKQITEGVFDPTPLKLSIASLEAIKISSKEAGISIAEQIVAGKHLAAIETVALNVCAALFVLEGVLDADKNQKANALQDFIEAKFHDVKKFITDGKLTPIWQSLSQ